MSNWVADNLGGLGVPQMLGRLGFDFGRVGADPFADAMRAQQRNVADWHEQFRLHREMTHSDLGLDAVQGMWLEKSEQQWFDWKFRDRPDAPYSFWLGADG